MAALSFTAANIRPVSKATTLLRSAVAGDTNVAVGKAVYIKDSDGYVYLADADAAESARAIGIVVEIYTADGSTTVKTAGDAVTVATYGPVGGFSSLAEGSFGYVSSTAGAIDDTAPSTSGTYKFLLGYCESTTEFFVRPQVYGGTGYNS